jgi:hypothetical protein
MKALPAYLLIVILSIIPLILFFSSSLLPHTHDGFVHLARIGAFFKAVGDGQIPVRWAGDLNFGYGMPLFNFIYHTPYLIASFFVLSGVGLVGSFKLTLGLSFLISGVFMFGFSHAFFKDTKKALLVTVFYQFFSFRFVEIIVRGSFGEVYTYTFFPLVLWGLVRIFEKPSYKNILLTSMATCLLVLSHNALSLVFFGISVVFVIVFSKKIKDYFFGLASLTGGLFLSAFYWIPAIFEHKYTYGNLFMKDLYLSHFPPIQNFFIPNLFNSVSLQTGGISVQLGIFHSIAVIIAFWFLFKRKINSFEKKVVVFCLSLFLLSIFIMQPVSKPLWENIDILRQFQFSWRMLAVSGFAASILSVMFLYIKIFKKNFFYFLLIFLVSISTVYYWIPSKWDRIDEKYYWNFPLTSTYFGETDLIWSEGPAKEYPTERVEIIDGQGDIGKISKKSNSLEFDVNAATPIKVVSHIQYFPGWRAKVDGEKVPIEFQYQIYRGEIVFEIPEGKHNVNLYFGESKTRLAADMISLFAISFFLIWGAWLVVRKK